MSTQSVEQPKMARGKGRPPKPTGKGSQVRIDSRLADMARLVAVRRDVDLVDYLNGLIADQVERDFTELVKQLDRERKG